MVKRKTTKTISCCPEHHGKGIFALGIVFLIIAGMLYLGYGWMEVFGILGILAIIKGLYLKSK